MEVAITHCGWAPDRKATLGRMLDQLRPAKPMVFVSHVPEHAATWATRLWEWCADHDGDGVLCLNDDLELAPNLLKILAAMTAAVPDEVLSLHTNFPDAAEISTRGLAWGRVYGLTGPAYFLPPGAARSILNWQAPWSFLSQINEDERAIHWAYDRQRPMYCAIPAPVTHLTSVPSSLGYDHHAHRTPTVPWTDYADPGELEDVGYWTVSETPPLIRNHWMPAEKLDYMRRVLKSGSPICAMCLTLEGVVSTRRDGPTVCLRCLEACHGAVEKRRSGNG